MLTEEQIERWKVRFPPRTYHQHDLPPIVNEIPIPLGTHATCAGCGVQFRLIRNAFGFVVWDGLEHGTEYDW